MCSLHFTRVLSVADSNTPVQYGIQPQCRTSSNWNPPNVLSIATLVDAREPGSVILGRVEEPRSDVPPEA